MNQHVANRDYPFWAHTRVVPYTELDAIFKWCLANMSDAVAYNFMPGDWSLIQDRYTTRMRDRTMIATTPRRELFRFKNDHDRTLFLIRWR